jgi:hypothetical protein
MNHKIAKQRARELEAMRDRHEKEEQDFFGALEKEAAAAFGSEDGWALVALISYLVDARNAKVRAGHEFAHTEIQLEQFFEDYDDDDGDQPEPEAPQPNNPVRQPEPA